MVNDKNIVMAVIPSTTIHATMIDINICEFKEKIVGIVVHMQYNRKNGGY